MIGNSFLQSVWCLALAAGLLVLPIQASAQSNTYAETHAGSGFDGLTWPHWLMVPQHGNNSIDVISPASPTFPISFFVKPDSTVDLVSPKRTSTSPQTITVHGETLGDDHQVAFGVGTLVGRGAELHLSIKARKTVTVALHAIQLEKGDTYGPTPNVPTAQQAQEYLNQIYGPQTNTYFTVIRKDYVLNYDVGGKGAAVNSKLDFSPIVPFTDEQMVIENSYAKDYGVDYNIYW